VASGGGIHQSTVFGFELGFEGINPIMGLTAAASAYGQNGNVLIFPMLSAQGGQ
jgi:hypothetical protein